MTAKINFINELGKVDCIENNTTIYGLFGKYRPFSNFHLEPVTVSGLTYRCSEAAYMAEKTLVESERLALTTMNGLEAKQYGQTVTLVPNWDEVRIAAMHKVLTEKFFECKYLADLLVSTGTKYIEETNWWRDHFWGVCNGHGQNHLGRTLINVRGALVACGY
jgi:ribA/ribD-fused uncharacterized protein